jgi:hypothetical protein
MKNILSKITIVIVGVLFLGAVTQSVIFVSKTLRIKTEASYVNESKSITAADIINIGTGTNYTISGTTAITRIYVAPADTLPKMQGRVIILQFRGNCTFTDGNNLKLAGNFSGTADDCIKLIYKDSTWKEIFRSAN